MFQVSEASRQLGINAQTIYFYERIRLIPKIKRTASGYRQFDEQDIKRLAFILRIRALGLDLNEIRDILALQEGNTLPCQKIHTLLTDKVNQVKQKISQLQTLNDELLSLAKFCEVNLERLGESSNCTVFEEMYDKAQDSSTG